MAVLLPCPCCGSRALFFKINDLDSRDHGGEGVCCTRSEQCLTTGLMFPCGEDVKPMLAEVWNRRASDVERSVLTDEEIAFAVRPLYVSDEVAELGLQDDIRMARAVLAALGGKE